MNNVLKQAQCYEGEQVTLYKNMKKHVLWNVYVIYKSYYYCEMQEE